MVFSQQMSDEVDADEDHGRDAEEPAQSVFAHDTLLTSLRNGKDKTEIDGTMQANGGFGRRRRRLMRRDHLRVAMNLQGAWTLRHGPS